MDDSTVYNRRRIVFIAGQYRAKLTSDNLLCFTLVNGRKDIFYLTQKAKDAISDYERNLKNDEMAKKALAQYELGDVKKLP